nr:MAG: replication initiator protein [Microvirus sp.]
MVLEAHKHEHSSFITLTYSDDFLPENHSLVPKDVTNFLKRLRRRLGPQSLRYYACGEYGGGKGRPHYHLAVFGVGLHDTQDIQKAWTCPDTKKPIGFVYVGTLTLDSAQYIAKYIQKGETKRDQFPDGRHPEFSRMSKRPGIGALAIPDIADHLTSNEGADLIMSHGDVPIALTHGRRSLPLGRYLRRKLREQVGLDEEEVKKNQSKKRLQELSAMQIEDEVLARTPKERADLRRRRFEEKKQKIRNLEARIRLKNNRGGSL